MPTTEGRREFEKIALECFHSQTYRNRELIIIRGPGSVGEKRNKACQEAQGEIICHMDDDDWSAPGRIEDQVKRLIESGAEVTGYHSMKFVDPEGRTWLYRGSKNYALGTSLCYWKSFWQKRRFPSLQVGEDNHFIRGVRIISVPAGNLMLATIHPGNTSCKRGSLGNQNNWERLS